MCLNYIPKNVLLSIITTRGNYSIKQIKMLIKNQNKTHQNYGTISILEYINK